MNAVRHIQNVLRESDACRMEYTSVAVADLRKLLALAEAAVAETTAWDNLCAALDAYEAEEDSADDVVERAAMIANACRTLHGEAVAARVIAVAALTEPTP